MDMTLLESCPLFAGCSREEIRQMLSCLGAAAQSFGAGQTLLSAGSEVDRMGLVLEGGVHIQTSDVWGNVSILDRAGPGQMFAETYACLPGQRLMVDVVAARPTRALFLQAAGLLHPCQAGCGCHHRLIANLLTVSAQKNLILSRRIFHTAPKTIRGRLLSYLSYQARQAGGREFDIPFDRQQLADYLGVERSALSAELGKMQRDGLLHTRKSHFVLFAPMEE